MAPGPFNSRNELVHHEVTHLPYKITCYGCSTKFRRYPDMLMHLEGKGCPSGISIGELNRSAAMCFQWRKYLDKPFRQDLLAGDNGYRHDPKQLPFKVSEMWRLLSAAVQPLHAHLESSPSCTQGMNGGPIKKLKRWLWKRLHWRKQQSNGGAAVDVDDATQALRVMALHTSF